MKRVCSVHQPPATHWVGDGFPVRTLFSYADVGARISPFLLLDYATPTHFPPTERRRGVGVHPHRGFETVTLALQGGVAHRDSAGNSGTIGPGDVQWMTAASGVLHEEYHSDELRTKGGNFQVVQLWVNLPRAAKAAPPRYQSLTKESIPSVEIGGGAGSVRVIAGTLGGAKGPAETHTPLDVWDGRLSAGADAEVAIPEDRNAALVVLDGSLLVGGTHTVKEAEFALLDPVGTRLALHAEEDARFLVLHGEPILEPVVGYGPFVMNTHEEIEQAIADLRAGKFGEVA